MTRRVTERDEGRLDRALAPPGACSWCGGSGILYETIDRERYDVQVPCWNCRRFCAVCRKYVRKTGPHDCEGAA